MKVLFLPGTEFNDSNTELKYKISFYYRLYIKVYLMDVSNNLGFSLSVLTEGEAGSKLKFVCLEIKY